MRPTVIGATSAEGADSADELERLTAAVPERRPWPHAVVAEELVAALFGRLADAAQSEQDYVLRRGQADPAHKRNRRQTYLDPRQRADWEARSRQYLVRRGDVVDALTTEALYSALGAQHYLELDIAELTLPPESRRSRDTFQDGINDQLRLDASRGRYNLAGELFHYAGTDDEDTDRCFTERLLAAVRRLTPEALLPQVSTALSQSGIAALERGSLCSAAMSGGEQDVDYMLDVLPASPNGHVPEQPQSPTPMSASPVCHEASASQGCVGAARKAVLKVTMQVRWHGFRAYILPWGDDAEPIPSDVESSVRKAATLVFFSDGSADVIDLVEEIDIRCGGKRVPREAVCRPIPRRASAREPAAPLRCMAPLRCVLRWLGRRCRERCGPPPARTQQPKGQQLRAPK